MLKKYRKNLAKFMHFGSAIFFLLMITYLGAEPSKNKLSVYDSIYLTLVNQKVIELSHLLYTAQLGTAQAAAGPFDYNTAAQISYDEIKNIQTGLGVPGHGSRQENRII